MYSVLMGNPDNLCSMPCQPPRSNRISLQQVTQTLLKRMSLLPLDFMGFLKEIAEKVDNEVEAAVGCE